MKTVHWFGFILAVLAACASGAQASVGLIELPADAVSGPVTVFYPTASPPGRVQRQSFAIDATPDAAPQAGRSRLVVISHGSPGSPWAHYELARALVEEGFTVALPDHFADNSQDPSEPGPPAWRRRPLEVSRAIDRLARDPRFATALDFQRVGMFGMSAGGHTALVLAGGRWSPSRLREHCRRHIDEDFHGCAGPTFALTGGLLDPLKKWAVTAVNNWKLDDAAWYGHVDPRIVAVVSGVPFAADFDPDSLRRPTVALALVSARGDKWLVPKYHSDPIATACTTCTRLLDLESGGHGALLGPLPPGAASFPLVKDPEGFDRATQVPRINRAITGFFARTLGERG